MSHFEESFKKADDNLMPLKDDHMAVKNQEEEPTSSSSFRISINPHALNLLEFERAFKRKDFNGEFAEFDYKTIVMEQWRSENGDTALHVMASAGKLENVEGFLGAGAGVNDRGHQNRTPLHCAVLNGHLAVAYCLLNAGAEFDAKDADGFTALELAERNGHVDTARKLKERIGRQSDVKLMTTAVLQGDKASVETFLEKGLSADECDESGEPALVLAAEAKRWDVVNLLLEKGARPTTCKEDTKCALVLASRDGQADVVRHLLRCGAASEARQVKEALRVVSSAAVVRAFVDAVPNQVCGEGGRWGLLEAAWNGHLEPLVALLDAGVSVNAKNNVNQTPLFFASWKGHVECVRELLRRGADVNAVGCGGNTPLHVASMRGREECVSQLLMFGASTMKRNNVGKNPLEVAKTSELHRIFAEHRARSARRNRSKSIRNFFLYV